MFSKTPIIVYLSSKAITLLTTNQHLSFLPAYMQHSEITDEKKYTEELQKFFQGFRIKEKRGIIIISKELVFSKEILVSEKSEKDEMENFLTTVPLERDNISAISVNNKKTMLFLATNKILYQTICELLEKNGIEIYSVVPIIAFSNKDTKEITTDEAKKMIRSKDILKKFNFLENREQVQIDMYSIPEEHILEDEPDKKNMKKQYVLLVISLLMLTGAIGYLLLWSNTIQNPWFKKPVASKTALEITPSVTFLPSPTAKLLIDKSLIKVQILNGSGTPGEAARIKDSLTTLGFINIEIGDAAGATSNTTIVIFSERTPKEYRDEILAELKKTFSAIETQQIALTDLYDVLITTGTSK